MEHDASGLENLERGLRQFDHSLMRLVERKSVEELIRIIKRPGWTTPAEFALVSAVVQALQHQVNAMAELQQKLVAAADRIGRS